MSVFDRLFRIGKANVNHAIDKMEDPVKMIDQILREIDKDLEKVTAATTSQIAVEKRFERELNAAKEMAEKREQQAIQALSGGDEQLAREALTDKKRFDDKVSKIQASYDQAKASSDRLKQQLQDMKERVAEMKTQRSTLIAQAEAAKAQEKINQVMSNVGTEDLGAVFTKMEDKILKMRDQAEAAQTLANEGQELDRKMDQLLKETRDSAVEDELAKLKADLENNKSS
ncbi:PspA/IM30 family protein [Paenibacillus yanchengensis]|uniref:PspA/IM30 family protein n=1 Tax=Paenibacillus yanchengensis TaxID=2035833 RepID=A0ABW4YP60_9BACL